MLDARALAAAALEGRLPSTMGDDVPEPHEARFGDHAVFVDLRSPVRWPKSQTWEQRFEVAKNKVLAAVDRIGVRAVLAEDGFDDRADLTLYTDDSARVVSAVETVLRGEALWEHAQIKKRFGPRGALEVLVKRTHADESHSWTR